MKLSLSKIKRAVIFSVMNHENHIDQYVLKLLSEMNTIAAHVFIITNNTLSNSEIKKLKKYTNNIICSTTVTNFIGAYQLGAISLLEEKEVLFDEIIFINDSIIGPLYSFDEMFSTMEAQQDLDFWGISECYRFEDSNNKYPYTTVERYLESSFIVIREKLFNSNSFKSFFENLPNIENEEDFSGFFEAPLTQIFVDAEFQYGAYINTEHIAHLSKNPLRHMEVDMVVDLKCPVMKMESFYQPYKEALEISNVSYPHRVYEYIRDHLDYPTRYIWEYILRTQNMRDIFNAMQLTYILPEKQPTELKQNNLKIGLICHIYYEDEVDYCIKHMCNIPDGASIFITTSSECMVQVVNETLANYGLQGKVEQITNRGKDVSSLVVAARDFILEHDLLCFVHDKKTRQLEPQVVGRYFRDHCYENVLCSKDYVNGIINLFLQDENLGILASDYPFFAHFKNFYADEWTTNYELTKQLLKKYNLNVDIDFFKAPVAPYGSMFWFRKEALIKLYNLNLGYEDFPDGIVDDDGTFHHAIERIHPFVAQANGYYSAYVSTIDSVRSELINFQVEYRIRREKELFREPSGLLNLTQKIVPLTVRENLRKIKHLFPTPVKELLKKFMYK